MIIGHWLLRWSGVRSGVFVLGILGLGLARPVGAATPVEPIRAIFDEGMYWALTPTEVTGVLRRAKRSGFNTYIPCVWHGQGTTWKSAIAPVWDANPDVAERDAFGVFLKAAKAEGMKVLPCFTLALRQRDFLPKYTSDTRPEGVFDVQNPAFREFARKMVLEFVSRYDVDGVNLDYVRAGQVCYDTRCRKAYAEATGRDLMVDLAVHKVNTAALSSIVEWQRRAVRELVTSISTDLRQLRPDIVITVDAAPWAESVVIEGQDSLAWAEEGVVDVVFSMNYEQDIDWSAMNKLRTLLKHPERFAVMVGNYDGEPPAKTIPRSGSKMIQLVNTAEGFNPHGHFAMYFYSYLSDDQVRSLSGRRPGFR